MNSIIKKGVTIIQMPPQEKRINKKTGVLGTWIADGKYKVEIHYKGKKYHLGTYEKIEDAKAIRETAEARKEDGTFQEWYAVTFPPKQNKYGVMGLTYIKERKKYRLEIGYKSKRYKLREYDTVEDAALIRAEADKHIADGTFEEWIAARKNSKQNNNKGGK